MTNPSTPRRAGPFLGTGALVSYTFSFKVFDKADLRVVVTNAGGVQTDLVVDSTVLVTLNPDQVALPGGSVQYAVGGVATALPSGWSLVILSALDYEQAVELPTGGNYRAEDVERGMDALSIQIQQLLERVARAVVFSANDTSGVELPPAASRALKLFGFDANGDLSLSAPADGTATALALQLASTTLANQGAGMVGFNSGLLYPAGTIGYALLAGASAPAIASIAALRALTQSTGYVLAQGYYTAGDGGGGLYWADASDTTSVDNGGTIIVSGTGVRWKLFRTWAVNVKQFGAKGDGITDDTAAIQAAMTAVGPRELHWLRGTYLHSATLVMPNQQSWTGPGGQRVVTIKRTAAVDSVEMTNLCKISNIDFDCQGGTQLGGRGIYISGGNSQELHRVRVFDSYMESLEFANNAGGGASVIGCEFGVINPVRNLTVGAIKLRDNTACPRFFGHIWLSGGLLDIQSGGNGSTFQTCYIGNIVTDANTALFHMNGGRVASIAAATILKGSDVQICNMAFSGPVFLQNAQGYMLSNNTYGAGCFITDSTSQYCSFSTQAQNYTPTWTQASGTQPVLNNGTISGWFTRDGYTAVVQIELTMGSTTTYGNNLNAYRFSLPYRGHLSYDQKHIPVEIFDSSSNTTYTCWGEIGLNTDVITIGLNGQSVRDGFPFAWGVGDKITMNFTYVTR